MIDQPTIGEGAMMIDQEQAVRKVLQTAYEAWEANDAEAFAALYVKDATVVLTGLSLQSRDEIRNYMATAFAGPLKGSRVIARESMNVRLLSDSAAVVVSSAGTVMAGETELPPERERTATWVLTEQAGRWRVAAYHNCPTSEMTM